MLRDPEADIFATMQAPDFPGGGQILFDRAQMENIYKTGRGSFRVRSRYSYDKSQNCIDVTQIPPTTTIEVIVERVIDLVKQGKLKEIADIRDETGMDGLKITIDLKRGTDPDKLMQKLFKLTTLEDSFACNFNVLIAGTPRVLGVRELLEEWTAFRVECVRRRTHFDLEKKQEKLHLLQGLELILLDIDKAIAHCAGDRGGGRGGAQPDDWLWHRPNPGGVRGGNQAAPPEPGVHPQAHPGNRRAGAGHRPAGGHFGLQGQGEGHHRQGAGGRGPEVWPAPDAP